MVKIMLTKTHLSLGIFNRLYTLLEEACQDFDLQLAIREDATGLGGASFQQYAAALKQLSFPAPRATCC